jgi:hypothetical protein
MKLWKANGIGKGGRSGEKEKKGGQRNRNRREVSGIGR